MTESATIAIYAQHIDAENAVKKLADEGVNMKQLSIIGKDYHTEEQVVGYYNTGDRVKAWGKTGAFWGGIWGILFGSAFFFIPGIGPVVMAGPLVATLVGGLEGAVAMGAFSALGAALASIGIPKDSIVQYETAIKTGGFVVVFHGAAAEVADVRAKLESIGGHKELDQHDA